MVAMESPMGVHLSPTPSAYHCAALLDAHTTLSSAHCLLWNDMVHIVTTLICMRHAKQSLDVFMQHTGEDKARTR